MVIFYLQTIGRNRTQESKNVLQGVGLKKVSCTYDHQFSRPLPIKCKDTAKWTKELEEMLMSRARLRPGKGARWRQHRNALA